MGKPTGFMLFSRETPHKRNALERVHDYREVYEPFPEPKLAEQAARCMDCGVPFCHDGCPLGNLIPDFNDLVYRGRFREASARLHATNNFPELTGRLCPAPCEAACVLGINAAPVTIKVVEQSIVDRAFREGWVVPEPADQPTGKRVAIVGSGPAGLACAQELARKGHEVVVFERSDRIGGLLRYGIPDFKMDKAILDRRLDQLRAEGVVFKTGVDVGTDVSADELRIGFDVVCLAVGALSPRDLDVPGRPLAGVHFAMEYLEQQNRLQAGDPLPAELRISAAGKRVVILGGGDTGADCLGTAHRQGAADVLQLEIAARPPEERGANDPWPVWPNVFRTSPAHEEGGKRDYALMTTRLEGEGGRLTKLHAVQVTERVERGPSGEVRRSFVPVPDSDVVVEVDLLLVATGFTGPERLPILTELGVELDDRGCVRADASGRTSQRGVFVAGDAKRGASLIVWAIDEGRRVARAIDAELSGHVALPMIA